MVNFRPNLNLRREIKTGIKKQHDLFVNNLVGDVKANPRDFYRYKNSQKKKKKEKKKKTNKVFHPLKRVEETNLHN